MTEKKNPKKPRPGSGKKSDHGRRSGSRFSSKEKSGIFRIESLSSVKDFLKNCPDQVLGIYCQKETLDKVTKALEGLNYPGIQMAPQGEPSMFWAEVRLTPVSEKQFFNNLEFRPVPVIFALDHITDPRNLGAIARSAAFFGISQILLPKDRQVCFSHASVNTSQGAFSRTELVQVTNLSRSLKELKEKGFWVVGCEKGGEEPEALAVKYDKVVLVLGNEEKGLSQGVRQLCDIFVGMSGDPDGLDSLNVSVAAGIIARAFTKK